MFNGIWKLFKEINPSGMPFIQPTLPFQIFKGFMIIVNYKFFEQKIMLSSLQRTN